MCNETRGRGLFMKKDAWARDAGEELTGRRSVNDIHK
jgi:hypothetical protein